MPRELTRTRTIFHPRAEQGIYRYAAAGGTREVNLLALAAANGHLATVDPIVGNLLSKIRAATGTTGSVADDTDPLTQTYRYNVPIDTLNRFPTFRVDYNLTGAHRVTTAWNYNRYNTFPDTLNSREARFPGFPVAAGQSSTRLSWSNSLRSTFGTNFVNEARVAYASAPVVFFKELGTATAFNRDIFSEEGGFRLDFPIVTEPSASPSPQGRNAWNLLFDDSISWLKGNHSITAGGSLTHFQITSYNSSLVPEIDFEVVTGDPALSMFTGSAASANFPGASTAQVNAARQMYALLTGRVSSIDGNARLENGKYVYMGNAQQYGVMREAGFYVQDSWRWKPNFTLNFGLRFHRHRPQRHAGQSRQRAARRDDGRRRAGDVQDPNRLQGRRIHAAAGRHRRDDQGVQRQRDGRIRIQLARRAERPLLRAGQRPGLHRGGAGVRRLRNGKSRGCGPGVQAV